LSRFSKIAGEMVPHMKIEECLQALLAEPHTCVVTAVPDASKASASSRSTPIPTCPRRRSGTALALGSAEALDPPERSDHRRHGIVALDIHGTRRCPHVVDLAGRSDSSSKNKQAIDHDVDDDSGTLARVTFTPV